MVRGGVVNKKVVICNFRFTVTSALSSLRTILGRFGKRRAQRTAQVGSWILARMQLLEIRLEISEGVMKSNPSLSGGRVGRGNAFLPSQKCRLVSRSQSTPREAVKEDCFWENDFVCKSMISISQSSEKRRTRTGRETGSKHGHITLER